MELGSDENETSRPGVAAPHDFRLEVRGRVSGPSSLTDRPHRVHLIGALVIFHAALLR